MYYQTKFANALRIMTEGFIAKVKTPNFNLCIMFGAEYPDVIIEKNDCVMVFRWDGPAQNVTNIEPSDMVPNMLYKKIDGLSVAAGTDQYLTLTEIVVIIEGEPTKLSDYFQMNEKTILVLKNKQ